jgi:ribonuclease HIII
MESGEGGVSEATFSPHAGMDESGKGDFFGPLCVASVFVDSAAAPILKKAGVTDSKKIKGAARISFLACEVKNAVGGKFATVSVGPEAYNRLYGKFGNLNHLLAWAHAKALENLLEKAPECRSALADKFGNEKLLINALQEKGRGIELTQKTKAESDIAVAAASIIARDSFLKGMKKLERVLDIKLPLGAGAAVLETAAEIIEKKGIAALDSVSKKHFATRGKACNLCTIR